MIYKYTYQTPKQFSNMIMNSDGEYLTEVWFEGLRDMTCLNTLYQREVMLYDKM